MHESLEPKTQLSNLKKAWSLGAISCGCKLSGNSMALRLSSSILIATTKWSWNRLTWTLTNSFRRFFSPVLCRKQSRRTMRLKGTLISYATWVFLIPNANMAISCTRTSLIKAIPCSSSCSSLSWKTILSSRAVRLPKEFQSAFTQARLKSLWWSGLSEVLSILIPTTVF